MVNRSNPQNDDSPQELIVAYLDGELSSSESDLVEQRLASDPEFREQLQGFDRAWAALDQLPGAMVDDNFSSTTMELVLTSARQSVQAQTVALPTARRKRGLATAFAAALAGLLGFVFIRLAWEDPNDELLADLPAIQFVDAYSQFQEVDFLRSLRPLAERGRWEEVVGSAELAERVEQFETVSSPEHRKAWVQQLSSDEKVMLRAKFQRFRSLSEDQQQRIRDLHTEVVSADNSAELQETMLLYRLCLNSLPPSKQFELRESPSEKRIRLVAKLVEQTKLVEQSRENLALKLTDDQLRSLAGKLLRYMRLRGQQLNAYETSLSSRERDKWKKQPAWQKYRSITRRKSDKSPRNSMMREFHKLVVESLPNEAKSQFLALEISERQRQMELWLRQAHSLASHSGRRGPVSEQVLEEFFADQLDAQQREQLLAMPRDEMQRELRRLYRGGQPDFRKEMPRGERPDRRRQHGPPPGEGFHPDGRGPRGGPGQRPRRPPRRDP